LALRIRVAAIISIIGMLAALFALARTGAPSNTKFWDGMLVLDRLAVLGKELVLIVSLVSVAVSAQARFTANVGEYFLLLLLATVGMMFLVASEHLLVIFVALELLSLSLYIMTAFNKQSIESAEAALKYFLFGGMSAAFMLFGLSLLYGASGELNIVTIASRLKGVPLDPLVGLAVIMVVIGFGFKVAAVPFHLWAPDTYQGAPLPAAVFIASGSKVASFLVFGRVLLVGFAGLQGDAAWKHWTHGWMPLIAGIAAASMVVGNLAAIVQKSVRRLLAYSAVAHGGYVLVGLLGNNENAMASMLYYVFTYALTVTGAFCVLLAVGDNTQSDRLTALGGFARREPLLASCMMVFILSLAGIPPLAGFFGKFYLFAAALGSSNPGLLWLVALAIAMSAVSLYYYLQVLKQIYVHGPSEEQILPRSTVSLRLLVSLLAVAVLVLGFAPGLLLGKARPAAAMIAR
jgi:NADH-quinone oxidoreductase subunit N